MLLVPRWGLIVSKREDLSLNLGVGREWGVGWGGGGGDDYRKVARFRHNGTIYRNFGGTGKLGVKTLNQQH